MEGSQTVIPDAQLFRDVFNASPVGIVVENLEGQPLFVNPAFCSMLGFTEDELRSKHCVQFSPPEDAEKDWDLFQQLRAGSINHYQLDKRYFRRDGSLVWGRLSISLLSSRPSPLVIAIVEEITDKKTAEEALRTSEERLRLAQQIAHIGSFEWNIQTGVNTWTPELEAMYGLQPGTFTGTQTAFENLIHADDRASVINLVDRALQTGQPTEGEWRVVWADGSVHWITGRWQVLMNESGEAARMIGVNIDITRRKQMEEALSRMSRNLIESQEQERTRIGRELHDDINQRLAMLAIELDQLQKNPSEIRSRVEELRKQTIEISDDVQALSHELDSSKLERLGAIGGMRSWCREFGERQGIQVEFTSAEAKISLPREIGLCLFRVLQEALHNAAKYSGVKRIEVQLREDAGEIHLLVSDLGRGFDLDTATQGRGLGLTSMQERVRLIKGIIEIRSKPMGGTTIHVRVPLRSEHSQHAAG
jgi:PAS domain S-box-containing protein